MSLDKHSFGDGAALTWDVPALRPLPARRLGNVEPDALRLPFLLLSSSAHPIWVATTCNVMRYRPRPVYARPMGDCNTREIPFTTVGLPKPCRPHRARLPLGTNPMGRPDAWRLEQGLLGWCQTVAVMALGG